MKSHHAVNQTGTFIPMKPALVAAAGGAVLVLSLATGFGLGMREMGGPRAVLVATAVDQRGSVPIATQGQLGIYPGSREQSELYPQMGVYPGSRD